MNLLNRTLDATCSVGPKEDRGFHAMWLEPKHRYIGRFATWYDGPIVAWGFWWFSLEYVR
jgi:hypothetical protein